MSKETKAVKKVQVITVTKDSAMINTFIVSDNLIHREKFVERNHFSIK